MRRLVELRTEASGLVTGTIVPYDRPQNFGQWSERFEKNSLRVRPPGAVATLEHYPRAHLAWEGRGLTLKDEEDALRFEMLMPPPFSSVQELALRQLRAGIIKGASIEMDVIEERMEGQERVITSADLWGFSLVAAPAHRAASVELRHAVGLLIPDFGERPAATDSGGAESAPKKRGSYYGYRHA